MTLVKTVSKKIEVDGQVTDKIYEDAEIEIVNIRQNLGSQVKIYLEHNDGDTLEWADIVFINGDDYGKYFAESIGREFDLSRNKECTISIVSFTRISGFDITI